MPVVESMRSSTNRSPMVAMTAWRGVPGGGDGADDGDAAGPFDGASAVGADVAVPAAVVDLAQRGEHLGAGVAVHRQDRRDVFDDEHSAVADLA